MPSAYIETTIPSYYVARPSMNVIQASRQASTRLWWDGGCSEFDLFTSQEVIQKRSLVRQIWPDNDSLYWSISRVWR